MKKAFILVYNPSLGSREEVKKFVAGSRLINTWRFELSGSFFLISEFNADEIGENIRAHFGEKKGAYFLTEIGDCQGMLEERSWSLINDKKLPPKE